MSAPSTPERAESRVLDARLHTALTGQEIVWTGMSRAFYRTGGGLRVVPGYSDTENWRGMGLVIEAMRAKGWLVGVSALRGDAGYEVCFEHMHSSRDLIGRDATTLPEAVAKAALAALEQQ